jgi:hypothetical protein
MRRAISQRGLPVLLCCSLALFCVGCAGWAPYEPRDERVEGPKEGLFSGEAGEFVIYRRSAKR